MRDEKMRFAKRCVNEQTAYLKDIFDLMRYESDGTDALRNMEGGKRIPGKSGMSFEEWQESLEVLLRKKIEEAKARKAAFESRLRERPEDYPLGVLFKGARLNAFERFAVAATAAVAMFNRSDFSSFDVRTLASMYQASPIKRLDCELYFHGDCKLVRTGIIDIEGDRRGSLIFEKGLYIGRNAYLAIMGKTGEYRKPDGSGEKVTHHDFRTRRGRSVGELVVPRTRLSRVVLPRSAREGIRAAVAQVRNQDRIFDDWGLGEQITGGRSVSILLAGPSGTGKTLTAEAFAGELGKKMLLVKSADIVSPYHGEDEIHASLVFKHATAVGAVLVFDEADSFFYARHRVRHSIDEASNRTVNVLLTYLEEHELPVILTTNRAGALDPALERRISLKVVLGPPDERQREAIWRLHMPGKMPVAKDVDIRSLAGEFNLTGGQIKNAVITVARAAMCRGQRGQREAVVTMADLEEACREEAKGSVVFGTAERQVRFTG